MQICVRDHVEVHPQKKKEVLYFVKKKTWEKQESRVISCQNQSRTQLNVVIYVYGITRNRLEIYFGLS